MYQVYCIQRWAEGPAAWQQGPVLLTLSQIPRDCERSYYKLLNIAGYKVLKILLQVNQHFYVHSVHPIYMYQIYRVHMYQIYHVQRQPGGPAAWQQVQVRILLSLSQIPSDCDRNFLSTSSVPNSFWLITGSAWARNPCKSCNFWTTSQECRFLLLLQAISCLPWGQTLYWRIFANQGQDKQLPIWA